MVMFQFIVLQILVFSGVIYFLKKIVYGDTESAIKRLGHVYQDLLNKQNELTQKIEQAEKEYQAKKEEGSAIIDKMKYDAMDDMRKKEDEIVKKARAEAEDIINKAHAAKDQFYREIEKELSRKMIDFISGLMGDVFTEKLAQPVHDVLAGMAKRSVPQIVGQRDGFGQILIETQNAGNGPGDLRHFQRMGQPGAVVIPLMVHKNLRFVFQTAKSAGMNDTVTIPLKTGTVRMLLFLIEPTRGITA